MAIPLAIPAAMMLASSVPQWYTAFQQGRRADQLAKNLVRPDFDIPESQKRALASAETQAGMTRLPGQDTIEGRLDQTTANKIATIERLAESPVTALNAASTAFGQQMDAENKLGIASAEMRLRNQDILRDQLGKMAQFENMAWNWDKRLPFEQTTTAIEALREGQIRNRNAAIKNMLGTGANLAMMGTDTDGGGVNWFGDLFGGGRQATSQPFIITPNTKTNSFIQNPVQLNPSSWNRTARPRNVFDSPAIANR